MLGTMFIVFVVVTGIGGIIMIIRAFIEGGD
jgi:hypothetical protein